MVSHLLQALEGFLQSQDALSCVRCLVAGRVLHIQDFVLPQYTVEVGALMSTWWSVSWSWLAMAMRTHEDVSFHDWCKCVVIVNTVNLRKTLSNKLSLVARNVAHCIFLRLEDPLQANDVCSWWCFFQSPSASCLQHCKFFGDGLLPEWPVWTVLCLGK